MHTIADIRLYNAICRNNLSALRALTEPLESAKRKTLLNGFFDFEYAGGKKVTPLIAAAGEICTGPEIAEYLIANGAAVNAACPDGFTPFLHAAGAGKAEMLKALQAHGAKTDAVAWSRNALHYAVLSGSEPAVEYLAQAFPLLINRQDRDGNTSLHLAAVFSGISALLRTHGGDVTIRNNMGKTPDMLACTRVSHPRSLLSLRNGVLPGTGLQESIGGPAPVSVVKR